MSLENTCQADCLAMSPANHNAKNFRQSVRFYTIINKTLGFLYMKNVLAEFDDINYRLVATGFLESQNSKLIGSTLLHIAVSLTDSSLVKTLLDHGADFTMKNKDERTALNYQCLEGDFLLYRNSYKMRGHLNDQIVDLILSAHVETNNYTNPSDKNGLSHFHIACMANNTKAVELFLSNDTAIDQIVNRNSPIYPGYTALHFAAELCCMETVELLLKRGANMYITDVNGLTALQLHMKEKIDISETCHKRSKKTSAISYPPNLLVDEITKLFLSFDNARDLNDVGPSGLSHFHVACTTLNPHIRIAKHFLEDHKIDVNRAIGADSPMWPGYTALHFASHFDIKMVKLLLANGADIHAKDANKRTPYHTCLRSFKKTDVDALRAPAMRDDEDDDDYRPNAAAQKTQRQKPVIEAVAEPDCRIFHQDEYSMLPKLHVLCNNYDVEAVEALLKKDDVDVNERASESSVWPGCTALHVVASFAIYRNSQNSEKQQETTSIARLLLDHGADVTLADRKFCTPLHVADKAVVDLQNYCIENDVKDHFYRRARLLLRYHRNFKVNPVDSQGTSHFHIACRFNEADVVRRFLHNNDGIDVDRAIDYFSDDSPGSAPIHLAGSSCAKRLLGESVQIRTVELLVGHAADVNALDSYGNNSLHSAAKHGPARERLFEMLTSKGADVNAYNVLGETPLEVLLKSKNVNTDEIEFFWSHGYRGNFFNPINHKGYVAINFSDEYHKTLQRTAFRAMIRNPNVTMTDEYGRTIVHNLVSTGTPLISVEEYVGLIKSMEPHCDIDDQDARGRTALHYAAVFENEPAFLALLSLGADINLLDVNEEPAYEYINCGHNYYDGSSCHHNFIVDEPFKNDRKSGYIYGHCVEHLHKLRSRSLDVCQQNLKHATYGCTLAKTYYEEIAAARGLKIGSTSMVIYDFLSETGAVAAYPVITQIERDIVDAFFRSIDNLGFEQLTGILNRQYRKALARMPLMEPATVSLRSLLGFPLPQVCCKVIFRFLKNSDLTNLIGSTN